MQLIQNENSVTLHDFLKEENNFYILMEHCTSNLKDYLDKRNSQLIYKEVKIILDQLNNTFKIMYDKGIIHRDINLSNILLKINNNLNKITFKLSGYGSNKILSQENESEYTLTDFNKDKFDELKSYRSEGVIKRQMKKKIMIVFKNN